MTIYKNNFIIWPCPSILPGLGQSWVRAGSGLGQAWVRPGSGLGQPWVRAGSGLGQGWVRVGQAEGGSSTVVKSCTAWQDLGAGAMTLAGDLVVGMGRGWATGVWRMVIRWVVGQVWQGGRGRWAGGRLCVPSWEPCGFCMSEGRQSTTGSQRASPFASCQGLPGSCSVMRRPA